MKKFIFIIVLVPTICFCEIKGFIELGKDLNYSIAYTELQIGYNFYLYNFVVTPYGNQTTWFEIKDSNGYPFQDIYKVGLKVKYDNVTIDLLHFCSHKVESENSDYIRSYKPITRGNLTKLSIRYDF